MNPLAFTLSAAAAVNSGVEPVTHRDITEALNPEARVVALAGGEIPTAAPLTFDDEAPQSQDPQGQDPQKQGAPPPESQKQEAPKQTETQPAASANTAPAPEQSPKPDFIVSLEKLGPLDPKIVTLVLERKSTDELNAVLIALRGKLSKEMGFSAGMEQLRTLDEEVYKKIIAAKTPEEVKAVLESARSNLEIAARNNEVSLSSLERALRDPEGFAAEQAEARRRIDGRVGDSLRGRTNFYRSKEDTIEHRISKKKDKKEGDEIAAANACDELRGLLGLGKNEGGVLYDKMPKPYLSEKNPVLRAMLTTTPKSAVVDRLPAAEREALTVLSSPNDPTKPLQPTEVRILTSEEEKARFARDIPVEGKDPRPAFREHREAAWNKMGSSPDLQVLASTVETLALVVGIQDVVMTERKITPGVMVHSNSPSAGVWEPIRQQGEAAGLETFRENRLKMDKIGAVIADKQNRELGQLERALRSMRESEGLK